MKVVLTNVRLSFPHLFTPQAGTDGGEPKYNAAFIVEPGSANAKALAKAVEQVAKEKWAEKAAATLATLRKGDKVCYREEPKTNQSGDVYAGFEGMHWVSASDKTRPTVIDRDKSPLTVADGRPYGGCYVNVILDVWPQDNAYGKRVAASLKGVQFVKNGDAFSGGAPASVDEFDVVDTPEEDTADDLA
jgi:hypothetical protein